MLALWIIFFRRLIFIGKGLIANILCYLILFPMTFELRHAKEEIFPTFMSSDGVYITPPIPICSLRSHDLVPLFNCLL